MNGFLHRLTRSRRSLPSGAMRRMRITWALLAAFLVPGAAQAAPGDPYVVYTANNYADGAVILRTDPAAGSLVEISRNGPQGTLFERPFDLAVEADGDLLVADMGTPCTPSQPRCAPDGRVIRVDSVTGRQTLLASGAPFMDPAGIAVAPDGAIYVADNYSADDDGAVIRVDPLTGAKTVVTEGNLLDLPFGILVDRDGSLVVSNRVDADTTCAPGTGKLVRVQLADGDQRLITQSGLLRCPLGVALDGQGRIVMANEYGPDGLVRLDLGTFLQNPISPNGDGDVLVTPERLALEPGGDFVVSDFSVGDGDGGIVKVDPDTGTQSLVRHGDLFNHPLGIATVVNRPPTASLRLVPRAIAAGRPIRLDASASTDPERLRLVYEWDLNGDGVFEAGSGEAPAIVRTWGLHGTVPVRVRVNDPHGGRAEAAAVINVDGSVPLITDLQANAKVIGVRRRLGRRAGGAAVLPVADAPRRAARIRFRLSEAATVRVEVKRVRRGRRARTGEPCRPRARRGRRCIRLSQARVIRKAGRAGANSVRVKARGLSPGAYRLTFRAWDGVGNAATERVLPLRVVRVK